MKDTTFCNILGCKNEITGFALKCKLRKICYNHLKQLRSNHNESKIFIKCAYSECNEIIDLTKVHKIRIYCSTKCKNKAAYLRRSKHTSDKPIIKQCIYCTKSFMCKHGGRKYCSSFCMIRNLRKNKKNPKLVFYPIPINKFREMRRMNFL